MDKDRQVRFLYPPFFLIFSILLAFYLDDGKSIKGFISENDLPFGKTDWLIGILGSGVAIIVIGFLIGTITINILRLFFICTSCSSYEISLSKDFYKKIKTLLNFEGKYTKKEKFYAGATFDHAVIGKGVHSWITRRWNAFGVSSNIVTALLLSLPIVYCVFDFNLNGSWLIIVILMISLFLINARKSWLHTMGMLEFQSKINLKKVEEITTTTTKVKTTT